MIRKKLTKKIVVAIAVGLLSLEPLVSAHVENIKATGSYTIGDGNENINDARQKAKDNAMRDAVEKAGVYVESYSKVENKALTVDEIRTIAGRIIKVLSCDIKAKVMEDGKTITYVCYVDASIDEEDINLKLRMAEKKLSEENDLLKSQLISALEENSKLWSLIKEKELQPYDRRVIENKLVNQSTAIVNELSKDSSIQRMESYIYDMCNGIDGIEGVHINYTVAEAEADLRNNGWKLEKNNPYVSEREYVRYMNAVPKVKERMTCGTKGNIINFINVGYEFENTDTTDDVYRTVYMTLMKKYGMPKDGDPSESHMSWNYQDKAISIQKYGTRIYMNRHKLYDIMNRTHNVISMDIIRKYLERLSGNWYDSHGELILSVKGNYINGCEVISGYDFVGGGVNGYFRIKEASGYRDLKIYQIGTFGKYLELDDRIGLRRTIKPDYAESVNGLYLGMGKDDVSMHLGRPDRSYLSYGNEVWNYQSRGIKIEFYGDMVSQISLMNNGQWHLDRSGLNYADPLTAYKDFYGRENFWSDHLTVGKKEYIWFRDYPREISLNLWSN